MLNESTQMLHIRMQKSLIKKLDEEKFKSRSEAVRKILLKYFAAK